MTELAKGSIDKPNNSAIDHAVNLLHHYSFDLGRQTIEQLLAQWLSSYSANWVRLAIIEALYQGRYKAISVEQILAFWQRRGQPLYHFNHDFERLVCNNFPRDLAPQLTKSAQATTQFLDPELPLRKLRHQHAYQQPISASRNSDELLSLKTALEEPTAGDPPTENEESLPSLDHALQHQVETSSATKQSTLNGSPAQHHNSRQTKLEAIAPEIAIALATLNSDKSVSASVEQEQLSILISMLPELKWPTGALKPRLSLELAILYQPLWLVAPSQREIEQIVSTSHTSDFHNKLRIMLDGSVGIIK